MAGWQDAPIVEDSANQKPAWAAAPVVDAAPPAPPPVQRDAQGREIIPDSDPVRAGLALPNTVTQAQGEAEAAPPAAPVDPNRQLELNLGSIAKGALADTLGAPVDLTTLGLNG